MITIEPDMVQFFNYVIAEGQVQVLHVMCYLQISVWMCYYILMTYQQWMQKIVRSGGKPDPAAELRSSSLGRKRINANMMMHHIEH